MSNPAIEILKSERDALNVKVQEADASLRKYRTDLRSIENAIEVLSGVPANEAEPIRRNKNGPTLGDMVCDIVRAAPRNIRTQEIGRALEAKGRPTDPNSVLSTLSRLKRVEKVIERVPDGWRYIGPLASGHNKNDEASVNGSTEAFQN